MCGGLTAEPFNKLYSATALTSNQTATKVQRCTGRLKDLNLQKAAAWTHLVNIGSGFGRCLHILDPPLVSLASGLFHRYLPALLQVRLVSHHQERDLVLLRLHPQDLLPADAAANVMGKLFFQTVSKYDQCVVVGDAQTGQCTRGVRGAFRRPLLRFCARRNGRTAVRS